MIPRSKPAQSKGPCSICIKRKVKCDREVPCVNCVKRGEQDKCISSHNSSLNKAGTSDSDSKREYLVLWQAYNTWVFDYGLWEQNSQSWITKRQDRKRWDWRLRTETSEAWIDLLNSEMSFKLLDYSVQKLGALFFGILSDVGELYTELEEYWTRLKASANDFTPENHLWNALLWSVLTLAVYHIPLGTLETIMLESQLASMQQELQVNGLTEQVRSEIASDYAGVSLQMLNRANFMAFPDVKIIQTYLVLASTSFPMDEPALFNSLLTHCLHLAKLLELDLFRPSVADATDLRLTKLACEKIWYRLCVHDYWQSGVNKPLSIHETNNSLLSHAAFLMDKPNIDVYQSEDTFEALLWKVVSLDRDINKYVSTQAKPPLKTLDAVQRQVDIFIRKAQALDVKSFISVKGESFIIGFLLNAVNWKIANLTYTHYDSKSGHVKLYQYSTMMVAQILQNTKTEMAFLNKLPFVIKNIMTTLGFHSLCFVFDRSALNEQLAFDLAEVCDIPELKSNKTLKAACALAGRLRELKTVWRKVRVVDDGESLSHPVYKVLENDILALKEISRRQNRLFLKWDRRNDSVSPDDDDEKRGREFMLIVRNFEKTFNLRKILDQDQYN
ncbi:LAFA_0G09164g1_1 [Lachancea sp. 'fantastica']|nr:LAFA_0G09164g1_1 [Lachancea sp. 'fantastica']